MLLLVSGVGTPGPGGAPLLLLGTRKRFICPIKHRSRAAGGWAEDAETATAITQYIYTSNLPCACVSVSNEIGPVEHGFTFDYCIIHSLV